MKETIIALIALAVIMGCIWLGFITRFEEPVMIETKENITITIPKKMIDK